MNFNKAKREDLQILARELGVEISDTDQRFTLKQKIQNAPGFSQDEVQSLLDDIVQNRKERLEKEMAEEIAELRRQINSSLHPGEKFKPPKHIDTLQQPHVICENDTQEAQDSVPQAQVFPGCQEDGEQRRHPQEDGDESAEEKARIECLADGKRDEEAEDEEILETVAPVTDDALRNRTKVYNLQDECREPHPGGITYTENDSCHERMEPAAHPKFVENPQQMSSQLHAADLGAEDGDKLPPHQRETNPIVKEAEEQMDAPDTFGKFQSVEEKDAGNKNSTSFSEPALEEQISEHCSKQTSVANRQKMKINGSRWEMSRPSAKHGKPQRQGGVKNVCSKQTKKKDCFRLQKTEERRALVDLFRAMAKECSNRNISIVSPTNEGVPNTISGTINLTKDTVSLQQRQDGLQQHPQTDEQEKLGKTEKAFTSLEDSVPITGHEIGPVEIVFIRSCTEQPPLSGHEAPPAQKRFKQLNSGPVDNHLEEMISQPDEANRVAGSRDTLPPLLQGIEPRAENPPDTTIKEGEVFSISCVGKHQLANTVGISREKSHSPRDFERWIHDSSLPDGDESKMGMRRINSAFPTNRTSSSSGQNGTEHVGSTNAICNTDDRSQNLSSESHGTHLCGQKNTGRVVSLPNTTRTENRGSIYSQKHIAQKKLEYYRECLQPPQPNNHEPKNMKGQLRVYERAAVSPEVALQQQDAELGRDEARSTKRLLSLSKIRMTYIRRQGPIEGADITQTQLVADQSNFPETPPGDLDAAVASQHLANFKTTYKKLIFLTATGVKIGCRPTIVFIWNSILRQDTCSFGQRY